MSCQCLNGRNYYLLNSIDDSILYFNQGLLNRHIGLLSRKLLPQTLITSNV